MLDACEVLVCNKCKADQLSACSEFKASKGYDSYCWSCESNCNKELILVGEYDER